MTKQAMINFAQNPKNDEIFTPEYAVYPILKYLKRNSTIWCPFDKENSSFVKILERAGHMVYFSHIDYGVDFFVARQVIGYKVRTIICHANGLTEIDYIISNPPFSKKDEVLKKLYELQIPFAMLLPLTSLEGVFRGNLFSKNGIELLIFDRRINFLNQKKVIDLTVLIFVEKFYHNS